ncbi:hypothetical protein [Lutibacter sp.]|uniref:DUF4870 domain-containing protein n=1 Tax=Lutibacter sp. TaxID=1925666 RepID=UPI0025B89E50|nr:hypothetical protein [Lutibacter sp.]MCF6181502.1 hypothetical protein [Lutibacter sp.]
MDNQTVNEGKTTAIISYITWFGPLVAYLMNKDKKNAFAAFHIRQMIGLALFSLANTFIITRFTGYWVYGTINFLLFILWIIGFIGALQGEEKKIPLIGDLFQDWFKGIA